MITVIVKNGGFCMQQYTVNALAEVPNVGDKLQFQAVTSQFVVVNRVISYSLLMQDGPQEITLHLGYQ